MSFKTLIFSSLDKSTISSYSLFYFIISLFYFFNMFLSFYFYLFIFFTIPKTSPFPIFVNPLPLFSRLYPSHSHHKNPHIPVPAAQFPNLSPLSIISVCHTLQQTRKKRRRWPALNPSTSTEKTRKPQPTTTKTPELRSPRSSSSRRLPSPLARRTKLPF